MNLFDLAGSDVTVHVDILTIPEFEALWSSRENKNDAVKIIKYIILNNYPLSPYCRSYLKADREALLRDKLLRDIDIPDDHLEALEGAFNELHDTLSMKALRYMRSTLDRLITEELASNTISIKDAMDMQPKLEKAIESIKKLEEAVRLELSVKSKVKGGYKLGILEEASGIK